MSADILIERLRSMSSDMDPNTRGYFAGLFDNVVKLLGGSEGNYSGAFIDEPLSPEMKEQWLRAQLYVYAHVTKKLAED